MIHNRKHGFSIIELLIVILIIGILTATLSGVCFNIMDRKIEEIKEQQQHYIELIEKAGGYKHE